MTKTRHQPREAAESPKVYLLSIHRYRRDETWHAVAAFLSHEEIVAWLETNGAEYPHGYAIETVPCQGSLAEVVSCEARAAS